MSGNDQVSTPVTIAVIGCLAAAAFFAINFDQQPAISAAPSQVRSSPEPKVTSDTNGPDLALATEPVFSPFTFCKPKYPLDYQMRSVCEKSQHEARFTASAMRIDDDVGMLCTKRYPDDWSMYVVCAKEQMAAKLPSSEQPERPDYDIFRQCEKKWPGNYRMEEYCIQQQEEARSQAGNWIDSSIGVFCTSKWPTDWKMFMYCVNQQSESKARIR
jgi:hypothetical protein